MTQPSTTVGRFLELLADRIDVPRNYYEKASERHRSLGEWLKRPESTLAQYDPDVRPQGSFRYGTVARPIREGEPYDLDNVCVLNKLKKGDQTQKELKRLFGLEVVAYAKARSMKAEPEEHNRCWRLIYADEAEFHLDTLPCVPEDEGVIRRLIDAGVPPEFALPAIAITDKRHHGFDVIMTNWPSSNPRGFARWFESRARIGRERMLREGVIKGTVELLPPYAWKTPLQKVIQILKRHRDVMFFRECDLAPISMIITNLAARAYQGEVDLYEALTNIVEVMPGLVQRDRPRVPNPADPLEDYADKWSRDPALATNFWRWHETVQADISRLPDLLRGPNLKAVLWREWRVDFTAEEIEGLSRQAAGRTAAAILTPAVVTIRSAPRPWGNND